MSDPPVTGFAMPTIAVTRRLSLFTLAGSVCLMAACGLDPPPAGGQQGTATVAGETAKPAGLALTPRQELKAAAANGQGVRCNIETMAGETLEAVHPTVAADAAVSLQGWYAFPPTAAAPAAASEGQATEGTTTAPAAATPKPILVIASENGTSHWVVPLPELSERRDVAKAFGDPSLSKSGFDIKLDLSGLRPGFYSMHLSDDAHSAASVCGLGRGFVIK